MIAHSLAKFYIKHILSILNLAYNSISYSLVLDWKKKKQHEQTILLLNTLVITTFPNE